MSNIQEIRKTFEQKKGRKLEIESTISTLKQEIKDKKRDLIRHEQARIIIREVGMKTMSQLQYHISNITSLALEAVFDDPYKLETEFVERRNKTECDLYFTRDGIKTDPLGAAGFGAVDIAAFALRIASWSMLNPHARNVIIMDEPFKHLKGIEANKRALEMINEISKKLNIQIIMVSDERIPREDIIALADRVFEVTISKKISKCSIIT